VNIGRFVRQQQGHGDEQRDLNDQVCAVGEYGRQGHNFTRHGDAFDQTAAIGKRDSALSPGDRKKVEWNQTA
jgi:hypothetical protein